MMPTATERTVQAIVGLIVLCLFASLSTLGVRWAFGEFRDTYQLVADFDAAGQGLIGGSDGSDVKIRGVNVGHVSDVKLVDGRARVTLAMEASERVPVGARAVIRPKTLFGEKFVDIEPGEDETDGPFLGDGDTIRETLGGFELERVLSDAYPILKAIDPAELATIIGTLADAGDGLGEAINRQIVNTQRITDVWARHDADTRQFLRDFADLADELAARSGDLVAATRDLNAALPDLNRRGTSLAVVLDQVARLSGDLADVFDANRSFIRKSITDGGKSLQVLFEERSRIQPLVDGLRMYVQTLAQAARIPLGDGTVLAAVKNITGGEPCGEGRGESCLFPAPDPSGGGEPTAPAGGSDPGLVPRPDLPGEPLPEAPLPEVPAPELPEPSTGTQAILDLIGGMLQ